MNETDKPIPTQAEMDDLLNPDHMSGAQLRILKKMDEKNVDRSDLKTLFSGFLETYNNAKNAE